MIGSVQSAGSSPLTRGKSAPGPALGQRPGLIPAHAGTIHSPAHQGRGFRAHPRSRGENVTSVLIGMVWPGSSPLTRGKSGACAGAGLGVGLIPAHAGKIVEVHVGDREGGAHPRSRGENALALRGAGSRAGSSPLTRGKSLPATLRARYGGLIPAHAGKIRFQSRQERSLRAHPRSRGENARWAWILRLHPGSSPLTRGKCHLEVGLQHLPGLIPAHAGKIPRKATGRRSPPAHPRSRGENVGAALAARFFAGSSPLTRGKFHRPRVDHGRGGLIPAHAGKIFVVWLISSACRAHPRSRGENFVTRFCLVTPLGSSPLTRGKWLSAIGAVRLSGLIPAHAGKIVRRGAAPVRARAHPRSRGENAGLSAAPPSSVGSSPLTRGKSWPRT